MNLFCLFYNFNIFMINNTFQLNASQCVEEVHNRSNISKICPMMCPDNDAVFQFLKSHYFDNKKSFKNFKRLFRKAAVAIEEVS